RNLTARTLTAPSIALSQLAPSIVSARHTFSGDAHSPALRCCFNGVIVVVFKENSSLILYAIRLPISKTNTDNLLKIE
ncbi:hypothetical protein A2U01_0005008, partial [Trifolium medium]|nr:hypothetical protein [Trifolium medium]